MGRWLRVLALLAAVAACTRAQGQENLKFIVQQAFDLHQKGQFSEALALLHRAHELAPDDYFVNLLLGIDTLRTGQAQTAVPFLKKAARLRPKEEFPLDYLGEAYARQNLYGEAAEAYIKAEEVAPASSDSAVAFVDFALSRFAAISELLRSTQKGLAAEYRVHAPAQNKGDGSSVEMLQRAADLDPQAPGIWSDLARAALDAGNLSGAESYSQRALKADPNDLAAWVVQAHLAAQRTDWVLAVARLNAIAQHSPGILAQEIHQWPAQLLPPETSSVSGAAAKFFSCVRQAKSTCDLGAPKAASESPSALYREQRWEQLTKLAPPAPIHAEGWFHQGVAFVHLGDCPRAIPALERGVATSSSEVYALFLLSWCYSRQAGHAAEEVQQSANDEAPLHVMRGDILLRLQAKPELAVSEYRQALVLQPNDPSVLERLAEAQFGAGKIEDARANAQAALKVDPQRLGAKRTLAKIAVQERDYESALPYLRELAARNPRDVTGRVELGKACAQTGALGEAWQNLAPPLEHGYPDEKGSLHYLLGTVLKKMGKSAEAEQAFATAAQLSAAFQHKSYRDQDSDERP